jgi:hypothetical protein
MAVFAERLGPLAEEEVLMDLMKQDLLLASNSSHCILIPATDDMGKQFQTAMQCR